MQYFAQDEATRMDPAPTVYETLASGSPMQMVPMIRNILGGFLFSGDDVYKHVRVLSGGERTRLAVARMLLRPSNTLLLDEPTNHLDLDSKEVLLDALVDYGGTLIFVSHDRYFVERLATKIIEIGSGTARDLSGDLQGIPVSQAAWRAAGARTRARRSRGRAGRRYRPATQQKDTRASPAQSTGAPAARAPESLAFQAKQRSRDEKKKVDAETRKRSRERAGPRRRGSNRSKRGSRRQSRRSGTSSSRCPPLVSTKTAPPPSRSSIATRP